jgi:T-complex protein 1 subunit beta
LVGNFISNLVISSGQILTFFAEHADFDGIERLALVLGGEIVSTFDNPELVKIGRCDLIEEDMIGEDKVKNSW